MAEDNRSRNDMAGGMGNDIVYFSVEEGLVSDERKVAEYLCGHLRAKGYFIEGDVGKDGMLGKDLVGAIRPLRRRATSVCRLEKAIASWEWSSD